MKDPIAPLLHEPDAYQIIIGDIPNNAYETISEQLPDTPVNTILTALAVCEAAAAQPGIAVHADDGSITLGRQTEHLRGFIEGLSFVPWEQEVGRLALHVTMPGGVGIPIILEDFDQLEPTLAEFLCVGKCRDEASARQAILAACRFARFHLDHAMLQHADNRTDAARATLAKIAENTKHAIAIALQAARPKDEIVVAQPATPWRPLTTVLFSIDSYIDTLTDDPTTRKAFSSLDAVRITLSTTPTIKLVIGSIQQQVMIPHDAVSLLRIARDADAARALIKAAPQ